MTETGQPEHTTRISLDELIDMRHQLHDLALSPKPALRSPLIGLHQSKLRGRGIDFDQVRIYHPGDDIRTIDWRVTARTREPHTKLFHEERERPIFILVEQSQRMFFGSAQCFKSVLAAQAAALLGWSALQHNDRIGGLVFSDEEHHEIRPRRNKQSLLKLLNFIALANNAPFDKVSDNSRDRFGLALWRTHEVLRPGSLLIVLCDERALTGNSEQQLSLLARHTELLLLPVSDPLDHELPAAGPLGFVQNGRYLELDTSSEGLRHRYRENALNRRQAWENLAQKLRTPLWPLTTQHSVAGQVRDLLSSQSARQAL